MIKNTTGDFAILESNEGGVAVVRITKRFSSRFMFEQVPLTNCPNEIDLSKEGHLKYRTVDKYYKKSAVVETEEEALKHINRPFMTA